MSYTKVVLRLVFLSWVLWISAQTIILYFQHIKDRHQTTFVLIFAYKGDIRMIVHFDFFKMTSDYRLKFKMKKERCALNINFWNIYDLLLTFKPWYCLFFCDLCIWLSPLLADVDLLTTIKASVNENVKPNDVC